MKKNVFTICLLFALFGNLNAQNTEKNVSRYELFIYTSDKMQIQPLQNVRGNYLEDLGAVALLAGKGIAGGYVTSVVDLGVNAIASLLTRNASNKLNWEEIVKAENEHQEKLTTIESINDFYSQSSFAGPMDPAGIKFNGIGCLRTVDGDTVFYISCHINESKMHRIIDHSKFELSLDTLIIDPYRCNLPKPKSKSDTAGFSFDRHKDLLFVIEMRLISSWMTGTPLLQQDQALGNFTISIPVNKDDLDEQGKLRYVRTADVPEKYRISGESFIVPRSYMGFRDENNNYEYRDIWGTGEYKIEFLLKETCDITDDYRRQWKPDWKKRQKAVNDKNFVQQSWKTFTTQKWDEIGKKWVITTLKAPADMINRDVLKELGLPTNEEKK